MYMFLQDVFIKDAALFLERIYKPQRQIIRK